MKRELTTAPALGYTDLEHPYVLNTDASDAVRPCPPPPPHMNYCSVRKELLVVIKEVKHFRLYFNGQNFMRISYHDSLRWWCVRREPTRQVARSLVFLANFNYTWEHVTGV